MRYTSTVLKLTEPLQANRLYSAAGDGCAYAWDMVWSSSICTFSAMDACDTFHQD